MCRTTIIRPVVAPLTIFSASFPGLPWPEPIVLSFSDAALNNTLRDYRVQNPHSAEPVVAHRVCDFSFPPGTAHPIPR